MDSSFRFIDSCVLCQKLLWKSRLLCAECEKDLLLADFGFRRVSDLSVFSLLQYVPPVPNLLFLSKRKGFPEVLSVLGKIMALKIQEHVFESFTGVIAVPPKNVGEEDHSFYLAQAVASSLKIPLHSKWLMRQEAGVKEAQKKRRLRHRGRVKIHPTREFQFQDFQEESKSSFQENFIIIDDVVTSGATLLKTWRALGKPSAIALTLASAPRYDLLEG